MLRRTRRRRKPPPPWGRPPASSSPALQGASGLTPRSFSESKVGEVSLVWGKTNEEALKTDLGNRRP